MGNKWDPEEYLKVKEDAIYEIANINNYTIAVYSIDIYKNSEPCFHFFNKDSEMDLTISIIRPKILYYQNDNHELYESMNDFMRILIKRNDIYINNLNIHTLSVWDSIVFTWNRIYNEYNNIDISFKYLPMPNYKRYLYNSAYKVATVILNNDIKYQLAIYASDIDITEPCFHLYNINNPNYMYMADDICISLVRPVYLYTSMILTDNQIDKLLELFNTKYLDETVWDKLVSCWYRAYYSNSEVDDIICGNNDSKDLNKKLPIPDYKGCLLG